MTTTERRYIIDLCDTDGDDGLFPQIYSVAALTPDSLTFDEAKAQMAQYVAGLIAHWRSVGGGGPATVAGMPEVPVELVPGEIEHWEGIGRYWRDVTADGIEPRTVDCPDCNGSGRCQECGGKDSADCVVCEGSTVCIECGGAGQVDEDEKEPPEPYYAEPPSWS